MKWVIKSFQELSLEELYTALAFRTEIFVVEQECAYQEVDNKDFSAFHVFAYEERNLVAYARILPKGLVFQEVSIGRVCVKASHRRKKLGQKLVTNCILYSKEVLGEKKIRIAAQAHLSQFYASFGFVPAGDSYVEDNIPHQEMLLEITD